MPNNNKELVLYGGTFLNKGGAAIAYGTLEALRELDINLRIIIDPEPFFPFSLLSLSPYYRFSDVLSDKVMPSISPIYTARPFFNCIVKSYKPQIRRLKQCTLWHIGDSPFSDYRSPLSFIGQVVALETLRLSIKPDKIIIGGVSIDYPHTKICRMLAKTFFKKWHFFARGEKTADTLANLGVPRKQISMLPADFAFHLNKEETQNILPIVKQIGQTKRPAIGLCLRDYSKGEVRENYIRNMSSLIETLSANYEVWLLPTSYAYLVAENDHNFVSNILNVADDKILNIRDYEPGEIISIFSAFDTIISARLHGAIYGILANVPTVHLYETPKSTEVIRDKFGSNVPLVALADCVEGGAVDSLISHVNSCLSRQGQISQQLHDIVNQVRGKNLKVLASWFIENKVFGE